MIKLSRHEFDPDGVVKFEYSLTERKAPNGQILCVVEGPFQRADVENGNRRVYPRSVFEKLFSKDKFKEQLEKRRMLGMLYHPEHMQTDAEHVSHVVTAQELMSDGVVNGVAEVLATPSGRIAETLFRAKVDLGISSRGDGTVKKTKGGTLEVQDDYWMSAYDFVLDPSVDIARPKIVENVERNNRLVADAIAGLVESELPEESRLAVLTECLKILGVLEGIGSNQVSKLSQAIQKELRQDPPTRVAFIQAAAQKESVMTVGAKPENKDTLAWHQDEVEKAVAAVRAELNNESTKLSRDLVTLQREHRELTTRHNAAKEIIEKLNGRIEDGAKNQESTNELKARYDAAVKLLDEALSKLKHFKGVERRVKTLEGLLDESLKKMQRERVQQKVKECLESAPAALRDTMSSVLSECNSPEKVEEAFQSLKAIHAGRPVAKEPLPEGGVKKDSAQQNKQAASSDNSFVRAMSSALNRL